jgi:hypothetical protein
LLLLLLLFWLFVITIIIIIIIIIFTRLYVEDETRVCGPPTCVHNTGNDLCSDTCNEFYEENNVNENGECILITPCNRRY